MDIKRNKILFVKPPDRFLEDEFVYQQLGPHYLQSYLSEHNIGSDMLILYERYEVRKKREKGIIKELELEHLNMLHISDDGMSRDSVFDRSIFEGYDIVGLSVMSPQASDAYLLSRLINDLFPQITTVIGGLTHAIIRLMSRRYRNLLHLISSFPKMAGFQCIKLLLVRLKKTKNL